jgi:cytochrome c556
MFRLITAGAVCAVIGIAGVGVALAQNDPITARQDLMKSNGAQVKTLTEMVRGQQPFDAAKASAAFSKIADNLSKVGSLFPADSKTGHDTHALPKIWQNLDDFAAKATKVKDDATAAAEQVKAGPDALKTALATVGRDCTSCHDAYRAPYKKN